MRASLAAIFALLMTGLMAAPAEADPVTPAPGSALRAELMDAARPFAEYDLGPPVLFEVLELLVDGDRAFGRMMGLREDGSRIDPATTPLHLRDGASLDLFDGPRLEVFYHRTGGVWRVIKYEIGSTDAWWFGFDCENYAQFFHENACN